MTPNQLFQKAHASYVQGDFPTAIKVCKKILRTNQTYLNAISLLGTIYAETGELPEAKKYLEKADRLNPASAYIKGNLGNVCKMQNDFHSARTYYLQALELDNNVLGVNINLGNILAHVDKDAEAASRCYRKAAEIKPDDFDLIYSFGRSLDILNTAAAIDYYKQALNINPSQIDVYSDLALALLRTKRSDEAATYLRLGLDKSPNNAQLRFCLCVAEGRTPDEDINTEYINSSVQKLFDIYAKDFDNSLVDKLQYSAPVEIPQFLKETVPDIHFKSCVDLGCGTGLIGEEVRSFCDEITGIDISSEMLSIARAKKCYEDLQHGEIIEVLNNSSRRYDLFVAAEVINYIGALEKLFCAVSAKANPNALFVITTERCEGDGYVFQKESFRYAHNREYVEKVAAMNGSTILHVKQIKLRMENNTWVAGELFLIKVN
ncbi:MAG: tetratricopeptide repeat protein [Desulfuromonadales bacterium]|nr:tetratricopeptide repeat protein [Desulfuromonadales bacterium]